MLQKDSVCTSSDWEKESINFQKYVALYVP